MQNQLAVEKRTRIELNRAIAKNKEEIEDIYDLEKLDVVYYDTLEDKSEKEKLKIKDLKKNFKHLT